MRNRRFGRRKIDEGFSKYLKRAEKFLFEDKDDFDEIDDDLVNFEYIDTDLEISKVVAVEDFSIHFDNGAELTSVQNLSLGVSDYSYLSFGDNTPSDIIGREFDLSKESQENSGDGYNGFFEPIRGYGILLRPTNARPFTVQGIVYDNDDDDGYGHNTGELWLVLKKDGKIINRFDISDCVDYEGEHNEALADQYLGAN